MAARPGTFSREAVARIEELQRARSNDNVYDLELVEGLLRSWQVVAGANWSAQCASNTARCTHRKSVFQTAPVEDSRGIGAIAFIATDSRITFRR